jgi:hypothetical protein
MDAGELLASFRRMLPGRDPRGIHPPKPWPSPFLGFEGTVFLVSGRGSLGSALAGRPEDRTEMTTDGDLT